MKNSYAVVLRDLYEHILEDMCIQTSYDRKELERDKSRLHSLAENRGIGFYTIDLPAAGKHFDAALSSGLLTKFGLPGFRAAKSGGTIPRLFEGMFLRVFSSDGVLRQHADITAVFFLRQLFYAAKKLKVDCDDSRTYQSVLEFFRIEDEIRRPSLDWVSDHLGLDHHARNLHLADALSGHDTNSESGSSSGAESSPDLFGGTGTWISRPELLDTIQRVADVVSSSLGVFDPSEWKPKHGPGAVADPKKGRSKYSFPNWPAKLESVFPLADFGFANLSLWSETVSQRCIAGDFSLNEPPAKLLAVPKTQKGPRLIASEPTAHQWCQQALNTFLRRSTAQSPIGESVEFTSQKPNQDAALQASLRQSHWTIDLSSASDRLSLWTFERIFRKNPSILEAVHATRTRWLTNTICRHLPKYLVLKKVAAQGAATTFPLQTIVYSIVVIGTMIHDLGLDPYNSDHIRRMAREAQVFGDDIVAPSAVGESVVEVLEYLGFKVNHSKTHKAGMFRESCGMDAFAGVCVTPAYFLEAYDRSRPSSVSSLVECSNNFHRKGLWQTADWMRSTLPVWVLKNLPVKATDGGCFGIESFVGSDISHLSRVWNEQLQRWERIAVTVNSVTERRSIPGDESLLQYFTEAPNPEDFVQWESGVDSRPALKLRRRRVSESDLI